MSVLLNAKACGGTLQAGCILDIKTLYFPTYLSHQTGQNLSRPDFDEGINTFLNQQLDRFQPADRR
jgi:hypothetical protein